MSSIYLAAMYSKMHEMQEVADRLKAAGHEITARWINGDEETMTKEQAALMDLADIDFAKIVIAFALPPKTMFNGGGRHVEFGYAYACGKRIIVVGEKGENVFHYLPNIEHYPTLDAAIEAL